MIHSPSDRSQCMYANFLINSCRESTTLSQFAHVILNIRQCDFELILVEVGNTPARGSLSGKSYN